MTNLRMEDGHDTKVGVGIPLSRCLARRSTELTFLDFSWGYNISQQPVAGSEHAISYVSGELSVRLGVLSGNLI